MNLNIQNRQQLLTVLTLAVIGLWVADKVVITPLIASWRDRSERIAALRKSVAKGDQLLEREAAIRGRWESMRANTLPENLSEAEGQVLKAFDQWSQTSRISVTSIQPQWKIGDEYTVLECRLDGSGNLGAIARFLYEIEKDPMALKVESLELSARNDDGSELSLGLLVSGLQLTTAEEQE